MNKLSSRKFIFACLWNGFVILGMFVTMYLKKDVFYMGQLITFAGTITAAYVGIQGYIDGKNK